MGEYPRLWEARPTCTITCWYRSQIVEQLLTTTLSPTRPRAETQPSNGSPEPTDAAPIIRVQHLGKSFKIYSVRRGRLVEWLTLGRAVRHQNFRALHDVSFEVARGESVGIIGVNGSGKSTLLRILSGALHANSGTFDVRGRVLSLLELGTGLNPELTGRDNVVQSARLLGFPSGYAVQRMEQIQSFAELGDFFDRPVRLYSSGMLVRLSFSMFACFDPEIFIVDEALSVGDVFFQQKCVRRIEQMLDNGVTMLFVSHDMQLVRRLCRRAILLSHGMLEFDGPSDECVSRYYSRSAPEAAMPDATPSVDHASSDGGNSSPREIVENDILCRARSRHGAGRLRLVAATFQDEQGRHSTALRQMSAGLVRVLLRANSQFDHPSVGVHLYDRLGNLVFAAGTAHLGLILPPMRQGHELIVALRIKFNVQPGEYILSVGCSAAPPPGAPDVSDLEDQCEGLGPIAISPQLGGRPPFHGIAALPMDAWIEK